MPHTELSNMKAVSIEFMLTAGLVFISCSFWDPQNNKNTDSLPLRAGFTIIALSIAGVIIFPFETSFFGYNLRK